MQSLRFQIAGFQISQPQILPSDAGSVTAQLAATGSRPGFEGTRPEYLELLTTKLRVRQSVRLGFRRRDVGTFAFATDNQKIGEPWP